MKIESEQKRQDNEETGDQNNSSNSKQELKNIDVYQHLRKNILDPLTNCKETLSDEIYYCITCKQSTCEQCSLIKHQNHKIYPKIAFYSYNKNLFDEVQDILKNSYAINKDKDSYIALIEKNAKELHNKIDEIKKKKISEIKKMFKKATEYLTQLENYTNTVKNDMELFYKNHNDFFAVLKNNDLDNSIFLLYYELNFLGYSKNLEMMKKVEKLKKDFENYKEYFNVHKNKTIQLLQDFLGAEIPQTNADDVYWDIKFRIKTYDEYIDKLKQNIYDIMKHSGGINDLKELVTILDSKNKKGIQYIFNQDYFTKNQNNKKNKDDDKNKDPMNISGISSDEKRTNKTIEAKRRDKNKKNISLSKQIICTNRKKKIGRLENDGYLRSNPNYASNSNLHSQRSYVSKKNHPGKSNSFLHFHTLEGSKSLDKLGINSAKDITLDDDIKKKYFTYSFIDLYNKLFTRQPRKSFDNNARIYVDYNNRNNTLKEYVKPIIGTNEIMVYDSTQDKSIRVKVNLNKDTHGYEKFPSGCRHLFIDGKLYICGGVDQINNPINTALIYQPSNNSIKKIDNMLNPHSYHSMEYLDNYDCFVIIGGENNKNVELFDVFTQKWSKLPDLNIPRANINIYFDDFTSELYALFGALGN